MSSDWGVRILRPTMKSRVFNPQFLWVRNRVLVSCISTIHQYQKGWAGRHRAVFFSIVIALYKAYTRLKSGLSVEHTTKTFGVIGFVQQTPCDSKKHLKVPPKLKV